MALDDLITDVTSLATTVVPDLSVFIAAGLVVALGAYVVRRFITAAR